MRLCKFEPPYESLSVDFCGRSFEREKKNPLFWYLDKTKMQLTEYLTKMRFAITVFSGKVLYFNKNEERKIGFFG